MTVETKTVSAMLLAAKTETLKQLLFSELRTQQTAENMQQRAKNLADAINAGFDRLISD